MLFRSGDHGALGLAPGQGAQAPPGEAVEDAARRRLRHELGVRPVDVRLVLPDFAYRASFQGVEEHELCPVMVCRIDEVPAARPDEVEEWEWWSWSRLVEEAAAPGSVLSPWARLQVPLLAASGAAELVSGSA